MKLVACGDSWTWGAELLDPEVSPQGMWNDPRGHDLHYIPKNTEYRERYRYIRQFAKLANFDEVIDLSQPSVSNDAIYRFLLEWLSTNGYLTGRDTSDLFISIGWTSPERTEFYYKEKIFHENYIPVGPWNLDGHHQPNLTDDVKQFLRLYCENFWVPGEYIHRYIVTIWQLQFLLKHLGIKYVMHQAFYNHDRLMPKFWIDQKYIKKIFDVLTDGDRLMWDTIDRTTFMNLADLEKGTFYNYILNQANGNHDDVLVVWHPNAHGHTLWAEYMYNYCVINNLL